jgi:ATPase subunit of ABC transporter with duplicated ATPase domains
MVDARLQDGSRVNAIIPPLALDGACLSIRRFGRDPITARNMLENKTLTEPMLELLSAIVKGRLNVIISGGTGAGKTTVLNVLSGYIAAQAGTRRPPRDPPSQYRGQRLCTHAPARHQQPAYASRSHCGRRGAR